MTELISRGLVIFQLIIQQVQYISLFNQLDLNWPDGFRSAYTDMEVINLNLRNYVADVSLPQINYRGLFTIVAVMLPILITLLILVIFQPLIVVILYTVLTFGFVVLAAGLLGNFLGSAALDVASGTSTSYIIAGGSMAGGALLLIALYKTFSKRIKDIAEMHQQERYLGSFHRERTLRHMLSTIVLILLGLTLTGLLNFGMNDVLQSSTINIWVYIGYVVLILGFINGAYFIGLLTQRGRNMQDALGNFINRNGLMLLLVGISSTFVPVLTYSLQMLMCRTYECPVGSTFNPYAFREVGSFDTSPTRFCDVCTFYPNTAAGATCNSVDRTVVGTNLCDGFRQRQSWIYPDTSCEDKAATMFYFAAVVSIAVFGISIPAVYFVVIRYLTVKVSGVSYPEMNRDTIEMQWSKQITMVKPVASSLYEAYNFRMRYFVLVSILQRVLIMIILVVIAPFSADIVVLVFIVYVLYFVAVTVFQPFLHGLEKGLSVGLAFANVFNAVVAMYVWKENEDKSIQGTTLFGIYVAVNIAIPLICMIVGHRRTATLPTAADLKLPAVQMRENVDNEQIWDQKVGQVHLSRVFMIIGVFFVIAFGACVVGMLQTQKGIWQVSTSALYQTNERVLAGYTSWTNMTQHCCCLSTANPSEQFLVQERWVCQNGNVIERGRVNRAGDGTLSIRPLCALAPSPSSGCIISDTSVPYLVCDDKSIYVPAQMSEVAYTLYW